jgi:molybdopterin molybdotransferase
MKKNIGFEEALEMTLAGVSPAAVRRLPLAAACGRFLAEEIFAGVDSPSIGSSRKDGYAVISADLAAASAGRPVRLRLAGSLSAGSAARLRIGRGEAVRVTTGARLPEGADAVIAEEFCRGEDDAVLCANTAGPGRNILERGADIRAGEAVARPGARLSPPLLGLIAAAGRGEVAVFAPPRAVVIATGDEVAAPGEPLGKGQLYASNMVEICAWLSAYGIPFETAVVGDDPARIGEALRRFLADADIFITSGGAWGSEKDLMLKVVGTLGWEGLYHRVRMGPGKPVGFGRLESRPFFVLPGGPPSNEMAFLQLALPALMKMQGGDPRVFPVTPARLEEAVTGEKGWTEFVHGRLELKGGALCVRPARLKSRLRSMAEKQALIVIPEEREEIPAGEWVSVQVVDPRPAG